MTVGSPHRTNGSRGRSRSTSRASSRGSSHKSPVYNVGPAPRVRTISSSSLSPPPSSRGGRQSRRSRPSYTSYGSRSGSSDRSRSRSPSIHAVYSDVDPTDLDAVLVRAAGEAPHRVIELLDKGADPYARSQRLRLTFMHRLVSNPKVQPELLTKILRHLDEKDVKALVGAGNSFDITPLHFTISQNLDTAAKMTEILLEHGADPGAIEGNNLKRQPLHIAASKGNKDVVEVLLRYKDQLNLDYRDSEESTALDNACWKGHMEVVELLYEAGSGIHIRDDHGWTPLRSAAQYGHDKIVNYLIDKGADIGSADNEGMTSLHAASRDREITVVETLLRRGAYVNARDVYGCTPLDLVAWKDHEDMAKILVNNGAAVEVCDYEGLTPLMTASEFGSERLVRFLLAHGGDVHRTSLKGNTALDKANMAHYKIMHYLIMNGAYSDKPTAEGYTPLMACVQRGYRDAVEILVQKGASLQKKDAKGWTPLMKAIMVGAIEIIEYFLKEHREKIDIDVQNDKGKTALIYAVNAGHVETVALLLEKKASVHLVDERGGTALHHAAACGRPKIATLLLEYGATVDAADIFGETPFSNLCATPPDRKIVQPEIPADQGVPMPWLRPRPPIVSRQWVDTMHVLLEAGADPNWISKDNHRPLNHAARWDELGRVIHLVNLLPPDALYLIDGGETTPLGAALDHKNPLVAEFLLLRMNTADFGPHLGLDYEDKYLLWAAGSLETHEIARLLYVKSTKFEKDPSRQGWGAMDWAAYRGMPEVLWALLCSVEDTPETTRQRKSAMRIAKELRKAAGLDEKRPMQKTPAVSPEVKDRHRTRARGGEVGKKGAKPREPQEKGVEPIEPVEYDYDEQPNSPVEFSPVDKETNMKEGWPTLAPEDPEAPINKKTKAGKHQEASQEKGQKGYKDDKWGLIVDMLRDPPIIQTSGPKEPFEAPMDDGQDPATLEDYEAAIVDFYAGGGGTGFLRRFRSLQETIYEDGPHEIMKQARETMQHVSSEMNDADDESRIEQQKTYTKKDLQFTWIHLPANNMKWMNDLLLRICVDDGQYNENSFRDLNSFMRKSWVQTPDRVSSTRFMRPQCVTDRDNDRVDARRSLQGMGINPMALYIPYLTFSRECKRGIESTERMKYQSLLEEYQDHVIHGSRTLDEFFYHFSSEERFQEDMRRRNLDQVVTKEIDGDPKDLSTFTAVRVDQIWLWMIDNKTLITSSTHRIDGDDDPFFTGVIDLLTKGTERSKSRFAQPRDALEMSQIIVNFCVGCFDRQPKFRPNERNAMQMHGSVRQLFSDSINKTAIEEADLFRKYTQEQLTGENGQKPKDKRRREAVGTAAELFRRIKDIRDELNILKALAEAQDGVQSDLMYYRDRDIQKARSVVKDIIELDEIAKRLQNSISTTLSLEQNDTAIIQSQESVRQGRTLMVFTVVTLLFLPMSFLTSFFALDAESFLHTPAWAFIIIFCVSMGLVIPLASYAFYSETIMNWVYKKWPSKPEEPPPAEDEDPAPLVRRTATSIRTPKTLSVLEEKNDYPTLRVDEVIKGIDRQTSDFKWPLRRRGTRRVSDVEALEKERKSISRQ